MANKTGTTICDFIESLNPVERRSFEQEREAFIISEMVLAALDQDYEEVKELAKMIGVSPTIISDIVDANTFTKALKQIGYNLIAEKEGSRVAIGIND